jgi:Spy/CpxP family protein refolding chaperone
MSGLIVLLTFALGAATGAGVHAWAGPHHHRPPPGPPLYLHELELTDEQRRAADPIFETHRAAIEAVMRESFPKMRALNDQMEDELRPLLTAAQAEKLDELKSRPPPPMFGGPHRPGGRHAPQPGGPRRRFPPGS